MQAPALNTILLFGLGLILLYVVGRFLLFFPMKPLLKLLLNSILGAALLAIINTFGGGMNIYIPLNPVSAIVTGVFGLPGVILLIIVRLIFV